jgi:hypothetical protein
MITYSRHNWVDSDLPVNHSEVARGRFELPSAGDSYPFFAGIQSPLGTLAYLAPNAHAMLDHYTTGLRKVPASLGVHKGFPRENQRFPIYLSKVLYYVRHATLLLS